MKIALTTLLVAAWILAMGTCSDVQSTDRAPRYQQRGDKLPNIVFFLVDDLGWRDVGCYGSSFYETPHVDRLAMEGVRFSQAYAACHVCSPTRASILTGKYPARLHLTDWLPGRREFPFQSLKNAEIHQHLPFAEVTLAEALKTQGYSTAIFGKWHLGEEPSGPSRHGFDVQVPKWNKGWPRSGYHAPFRLQGLKDSKGDYLTDRLTDEALNYIEQNKERPFFLYLSHFAVHDPIQGRPDLVKKYRMKLEKMKRPKAPAFVLEGNPDAPKPVLSNNRTERQIAQPARSTGIRGLELQSNAGDGRGGWSIGAIRAEDLGR